jgi:hypothetical protein
MTETTIDNVAVMWKLALVSEHQVHMQIPKHIPMVTIFRELRVG